MPPIEAACKGGAMSGVTWIGLLAAFCTTLAYAPQAIKTWRTRSTADISLGMFSLMVVGIVFWLVYGLLIEDLPLILANLVTLSLAGTILVLKLRHG
jgi:MtN3 and saliva related transmembrane protein